MEKPTRKSATAWVAGFYAIHAWQVALMDERLQHEVWGDGGSPDTGIASSYAPTGKVRSVEGGYVLSGTWAFSSGIDGAEWIILGGVIGDRDGGPQSCSFVVPKRDYAIRPDSWNVIGLAGSGSKTITLDDAFVPELRTHHVLDVYQRTERGFTVNDRPLYHLSWQSLFFNAISAVSLGAATGAVNAFIELNRHRKSALSGTAAANNPFLQLRLGNAVNTIELVTERLPRRWREDFDRQCAGPGSDVRFRKMVRFEGADATAAVYSAVSEIIEMGGGNVIDLDNPVQRYFRDLLALRNHPATKREPLATIYAQDLLGVPAPPFSPSTSGMLSYYA